MKSEPDEVSVDDVLARADQTIPWFGVRGYQARNFMRDQMQLGDGVLFYHSSCPQPGIVGLAEMARTAYPDATQFDPQSKYYDAKSTADAPRWVNVDVRVTRRIALVSLEMLRDDPELAEMIVLRRGNRLSITPVTPAHWRHIVKRWGNRKPD